VADETRKANRRRIHDPLFDRVFRGRGIDIGPGDDRLDRDGLFAGIEQCDHFDVADGDAQEILNYRPASSYNFVYSSHCLEHLSDPIGALKGWFDLLQPFGFLIVVVPDEDLYEQGNWPSPFDRGHKWSFTFKKRSSWSPRSINIIDAVLDNIVDFSFVRVSVIDDNYKYFLSGVDQSMGSAETNIELIIQKLVFPNE
jgi:SAM-dependent methyltransferase